MKVLRIVVITLVLWAITEVMSFEVAICLGIAFIVDSIESKK